MMHMEIAHDENVQCTKCDFKGYPNFELVYHQMKNHGNCPKCNGDCNDENQHLDFQHPSRILECVNAQNESKKPRSGNQPIRYVLLKILKCHLN